MLPPFNPFWIPPLPQNYDPFGKMHSSTIVSTRAAVGSPCAFAPLISTRRRAVSLNCDEDEHTLKVSEMVLDDPGWPDEWPYSEGDLARMDESDDAIFYISPHLVYDLDEVATSGLTYYYFVHLVDGQDVLDLCSSWASYFPYEWRGGYVAGLGMNEYELSQNDQLTNYVVKDINAEPVIPFQDNAFDVVTCVSGVEYLIKPREVFKEIGRVLRPGGTCMVVISKCVPTTKIFHLWLKTSDEERIWIAGSFFHYSGMFDPPWCEDISPLPGLTDPLYIVKATKKQ